MYMLKYYAVLESDMEYNMVDIFVGTEQPVSVGDTNSDHAPLHSPPSLSSPSNKNILWWHIGLQEGNNGVKRKETRVWEM